MRLYVHHEAKLIYLAQPRTASIATGAALRRVGFVTPQPGDHHSELYYPASPVTKETRHEWCVATTVRNHWDACASWTAQRSGGFDLSGSPWPKAAFVAAINPDKNSWTRKKTLYHMHLPHADVVMRFESLESDLRHWLTQAGLQMPFLARDNVSSLRDGRHYSELYDDETEAYIGLRFHDEIVRLGYRFERQTSRKEERMEDDRIDQLERNMNELTRVVAGLVDVLEAKKVVASRDVTPVQPGMEMCAGCGAQAKEHPWVGIMHVRDLPAGYEPLAVSGRDFCAVNVCASCYADGNHQVHYLKCHFFDRYNAQGGLAAAGSNGQVFTPRSH